MNDKLYLRSTDNPVPGRRRPAPTNPVEKSSVLPILTVPECDSSGELTTFCDELLWTLDLSPKRLALRFVGTHEMSPDSALIIYDILTTQRSESILLTEAWSPLLGPSVLVWLAGDVRRIRSTAYLLFRSLKEVQRCRRPRLPWEDQADLWARDAEPEVNPAATDYRTVLQLLDQYLPVDQLAGKIITPEMLSELGLVGHSPLDDLLRKCLARDNSTASINFAGEGI